MSVVVVPPLLRGWARGVDVIGVTVAFEPVPGIVAVEVRVEAEEISEAVLTSL